MRRLKEFRDHPKSFADMLVYEWEIEDGIVLGKDGSLIAGWEYRGPDMDAASGPELDVLTERFNSAMARFEAGWMFHIDAVRVEAAGYRSSDNFQDPSTWLLDVERRKQYEAEGGHYETRTFLTVTYLTPSILDKKVRAFLLPGDGSKKGGSARNADFIRHLELFKHGLDDIEDSLSPALEGKIWRMQAIKREMADGKTRVDDMLVTHLNRCVNGENRMLALHFPPVQVDVLVGSEDVYAGIKPKIGSKFVRVIGVHGFPPASYPGICDILGRLPMQFRWSHRFICMNREAVQKELNFVRSKWGQKKLSLGNLMRQQAGDSATHVDQDAMGMHQDAVDAMEEASAGNVAFGYYCGNVIIHRDTEREADDQAREIAKMINNAGFKARVEEFYALEAFIGTLPGHGITNVRKYLINTLNLSHLLPITNLWTGVNRHPSPMYPKDSPPLAYVSTDGSTPFRLNLHFSDVGHTMIIGPTGSGKSVLLNFLAASEFKYKDASVYAFDKGRSMYVLCAAAGGRHHDLGLTEESDASGLVGLEFQPLARVDIPSEAAWAEDWLMTIAKLNQCVATPTQRAAVNRALKLLAGQPVAMRTMSNFQSTLQDQTLRAAFAGYTINGHEMGRVFDGDNDGLGKEGFVGFHVFETDALSNMDQKWAAPILLYIFHRIEKSLRGQPAFVILDEAWAVFQNDMFREKIREWLKTLRKYNAAVIFATQSITDITSSKIADVLLESCPTKIYLANPEATRQNSLVHYQALGLSPREISIVSMMQPKKDYYFTNPAGRRKFMLELGPVALAFLTSSSREKILEIQTMMREYPEVWPMHLLWEFGVSEQDKNVWLDRLKTLKDRRAG